MNGMTRWRSAALLLACIALATVARAGTIIAVTSFNPGLGSASNGSVDFGWQFSLSQTITVTDLGVYDGGFSVANEVVIYQCPDSSCATNTAVVSGLVAADAPDDADFVRYSPLGSPVVLNPGDYVITEQTLGLPIVYQSFGPVFGTGITYVQGRYLLADSSAFPDTIQGPGDLGFFGPNFQYDLGDTTGAPGAPEPATGWLFAATLVLFGPAIVRRAGRRGLAPRQAEVWQASGASNAARWPCVHRAPRREAWPRA